MTPAIRDLLHACACAGVGLSVDGDRLLVRWTAAEDDALRQRLRAAKLELLVALAEEPEGPDDPRWVVQLLADVGRWRAWMRVIERHIGPAGPADNVDGWTAYLVVVDGAAP